MGIDIKRLPAPVRAFFNGIAQVVFIENVISGAAIFVSFFIAGLEMNGWNFGSWESWKWVVFVAIGVNISNLVAYLIGADHDAITSGLFGFCPNLICMGAWTFSGMQQTPDWWTPWIVMILGCILCPMLQITINRFAGHFGLPGFTFPFIVMTWFFCLISIYSGALNMGRVATTANEFSLATTVPGHNIYNGFDGWSTWGWEEWGLFFTNGFEEIYVYDGFIASVVIIAAYFWYNWQFALKACLAMAISIGMGLLFGIDMGQMLYALCGYSAILTAGALDTFGVSKRNGGRYWFLWFFGVISTCLINYAIYPIFSTFGLPNCTFAFVLAGWIMLVVEHFMVEQAEKRAAAKAAAAA